MSTNSTFLPTSTASYGPPVPVIVTVIFLVLFFFGFFAIYFCRCFLDNLAATWNQRRQPSGALIGSAGANMRNGLDPELIQAFPTFSYSTVKEFRRQKYGLECAICLGEFKDEDMLRLLTICCHVFHEECVDLWLESHKTCPVCRGELDVPRKSIEKSPMLLRSNSTHEANESSLQDAVCIDIKEEDVGDVDRGEADAQVFPSTQEQHQTKHNKMERFPRSHSTGHSIARIREEEDKYTLRLPDHVRIKIIKGHNSAGSCIPIGDFSRPSDHRNGGLGETSETGGEGIDKV